MWEYLWLVMIILGNVLVFILYSGHIKAKLNEMRDESRKMRRKDEKILKLYQEIEEMLNSFESYVGEVHEELESRRAEMLEMSRQATTLYMQVMQPGVFMPKTPSQPLPEEPEPAAQSVKPTPEPKAEPSNSRLSNRDRTELGKMVSKGQKVRFLMTRGLNIDEVARELGIGKGEVHLIVDLDKK